MEALLISAGVVALAEIGDKTQLLALVLAARFRAPLPIIFGILTATLTNHFAAGLVGTLLAAHVNPVVMRWLLALSFFAAAAWMFIPDKAPQGQAKPSRFGAYGTTVISFFLAEMGDKTQFATVALAARFQALIPVVAGTTLGMLLADVPAVYLGKVAAERLPIKLMNLLAAAVFAALGVWALYGAQT
jgi:putative Ca2+/H+ antiporter (TMEM165/GDT1 family)